MWAGRTAYRRDESIIGRPGCTLPDGCTAILSLQLFTLPCSGASPIARVGAIGHHGLPAHQKQTGRGEFSGGRCRGHDCKAECGGATLEGGDAALALLLLVVLLTLIDIGFTAGQRAIHHARRFVRGGGIGVPHAPAGCRPPVRRPPFARALALEPARFASVAARSRAA